jgi:hypothetical protein
MGLMRPASKKKVISRTALASRSRIGSNTIVGNGSGRVEAEGIVACVDWDNLSTEQLDEIQPWLQLANEPEDSYKWFVHYLDLGSGRTLTKLTIDIFPDRVREATKANPRAKYHISTLLSEARRNFDWDRRVASFDGYTARKAMKRLEENKIRQQTKFHQLAADLTEDTSALIDESIPDATRHAKAEKLIMARELLVGKDQGYGKLVVDLNKAVNGEKQLIDARVASVSVPWNPS